MIFFLKKEKTFFNLGIGGVVLEENKIFCRSCGRELVVGSRFCDYCGAKVIQPMSFMNNEKPVSQSGSFNSEQLNIEEKGESQWAESTAQEESGWARISQQDRQNVKRERRKRSSETGWNIASGLSWILAIIAIVVIMAIINVFTGNF